MMCNTHLRLMIGWLTTDGINAHMAMPSGLEWERKTLFTRPWLMFLSAPVAPAAWWSFRQGKQMILSSRWVTIWPRCERKVRSSLGS